MLHSSYAMKDLGMRTESQQSMTTNYTDANEVTDAQHTQLYMLDELGTAYTCTTQ